MNKNRIVSSQEHALSTIAKHFSDGTSGYQNEISQKATHILLKYFLSNLSNLSEFKHSMGSIPSFLLSKHQAYKTELINAWKIFQEHAELRDATMRLLVSIKLGLDISIQYHLDPTDFNYKS